MTHVLALFSSPRGSDSLSTKIAKALLDRLAAKPDTTVTTRDLGAEVPAHIEASYMTGRFVPAEQRAPDQLKAVSYAEALVDELKAANVVVIAASMINFGPPSNLKAWIDHIVWPGVTMVPTHDGPRGLIKGKKVYVVATSGGIYSSGPMATNDMLVPYLKQILGFIGMTDIEVIRAEAQSFGPEEAGKSVEAAFEQVRSLDLAAV